MGATRCLPNYAMKLSVRDLATFGAMYLAGGEAHGRRVVPADWVARSTRPAVSTGLPEPFGHYGYLWWVSNGEGTVLSAGSLSAVGVGGQTSIS